MNNDRTLTLREGLNRLREENASVFSERDITTDVQEFFRCHDTAHVVFGCDTSIFGEGVLKVFTIFGTTLGFWKHLSAYSEANAFALFRQYPVIHVFKNLFRLIITMPRVYVRAKRMSRPWPWAEHHEYLDTSIQEIRSEFNIKVFRKA